MCVTEQIQGVIYISYFAAPNCAVNDWLPFFLLCVLSISPSSHVYHV